MLRGAVCALPTIMMFIVQRHRVSAMQSHPRSRKRPASGLTPISEYITLGTLADRARALDALDEKLRRTLPDSIAHECRLADVRNGRVVFLATSATWATRLRLHHAALLSAAQSALGGTVHVERITVKVAPLPSVPPDKTRRKPLSAAAAQHLEAAAKSMADPELRALYLRLASLAVDPSQ